MQQRQFQLLSTFALLALFGAHAQLMAAEDVAKPNIILIMADDLGYGHLGCYGQKKIKTPNIDRMAKQGMRFTQFYAGSAVCAPSRSVLMQGLHSGHTGVRINQGSASLLDSEITIAEVLKKAGYTTGGFGKWGLGVVGTPGVPHKQGFDVFFGFYHQVHAHFYYPYWIRRNDEKVILKGNINKRETYIEDHLHNEALAFIKTSAKKKRPFFCYIPSIVPHIELTVPEDSMKQYVDKFPKVTINDRRRGYIGSDHAYATYAGMISRLDRHVGEILDLLQELDVDENTLVIFTSDNGPQNSAWSKLYQFFNGSGVLRGSKGSLHEGGLRVPMIARWPDKIKAGTESDLISGFQDFMPTFAQLASVKAPTTDGVSLVPTLLGHRDKQKKHKYLYWELGKAKAIRAGDWKAVKIGNRPWMLFDLGKDGSEKSDVAGKHPKTVEQIRHYAMEAHTPPRQSIGSQRVGISDYVRGDRVDKKNAR